MGAAMMRLEKVRIGITEWEEEKRTVERVAREVGTTNRVGVRKTGK